MVQRLSWAIPTFALAISIPSVAVAQGGGGLPVPDTYAMIANWATTIASFLNMMTWFVFVFLTQFLDPRFIFDLSPSGEEGGLMEVLNSIWQLSRNLMNVGFAVGLVIAAIYTVVKGDREFISSNLKNFILAVVLVNFSWFIPRVVLDVAHIAAATIFSIPTALVAEETQCRYVSTTERECIESTPGAEPGTFICACRALADFEPFPGTTFIDEHDGTLPDGTIDPVSPLAWQCTWAYCARFVKLDGATSTTHGAVLNGLIVNHARLPQLAMITRVDEGDDDIASLLMFVLRELIVVAIHAALFFPLLALLLALAIRIPILWFTIAFMPFYFVTFVLPDGLGLDQIKKFGNDIKTWFLKAAFLPAAVAIPLTIGFIMANAGSRIPMPVLEDIGFTVIDSMGSFSQLLWLVMVLGIFWSGTFMILELMMIDEIPGKNLVQGIKNTGEQAGKFAAQLPLATIPIPGLGTSALNAAGLLNPRAWNNALRHPDGGIAGLQELGTPRGTERNETRQAASTLARDPVALKKLQDAIKEFKDSPRQGKFDDLKNVLQESGIRNTTITKENFHTIVQELHTTLKDNHGGQELMDNRLKTAFDTAVQTFRGGGAPPAPPGP